MLRRNSMRHRQQAPLQSRHDVLGWCMSKTNRKLSDKSSEKINWLNYRKCERHRSTGHSRIISEEGEWWVRCEKILNLKVRKKTLFYEHFYHKTLGDLFRKISLLTTHSMNHYSREFTKCFSSPSHSILQITRTCALFLQMANEWKLPQFTTKATLRVSLWGVITIFEVRKVMGGLIKPFFSHLHKLIAPLQATIKWYWTETSTFTGSRRPGQMYMAWTSSSAWIKVAF